MIAGHAVEGGLIYVGRNLPSVSSWRGVEPALIDPRLRVDNRRPDLGGEGLRYWPSYSEIPPASRAAYLGWLADGRRNPVTPAGYVFLFFYGLERRLLADAITSPTIWDEASFICAEVERLLGIYGGNASFRSYASRFLDTVAAVRSGSGRMYDQPPPAPATSWEIPTGLKIGLAQLALDARPVPAHWALAWVRAHPEARLRTPARRCPEKFASLFAIRYRERFGEGLVIKPNKAKLVEYYRPASASFGGQVRVPLGELPDIAALSAPVRKFVEIAD
ncbi:MAG: TerB N-terminal domain-containing protein, partial [Actinomycetota bacterium]